MKIVEVMYIIIVQLSGIDQGTHGHVICDILWAVNYFKLNRNI